MGDPGGEVLPSIPCSRNLRRRTGVWMGVEAWELFLIASLSLLPDVAYRIGLMESPNLLLGLAMSGTGLAFIVLFKRNKPPNFFAIWIHHHFIHPDAWRAPKASDPRKRPIKEET
jgi:hypothetical protein